MYYEKRWISGAAAVRSGYFFVVGFQRAVIENLFLGESKIMMTN